MAIKENPPHSVRAPSLHTGLVKPDSYHVL